MNNYSEIILVNIEGEYIMLHSVCCATGSERALESFNQPTISNS